MTRSRTHSSPARRVLAVCALTGAALLTSLSGGQAWADGAPKPAPAAPDAGQAAGSGAAPSAVPQPKVSRPATSAPTAWAAEAGSGAAPSAVPQPKVSRPATPAPTAWAAEAAPATAPAGGSGSGPATASPQVRAVPKGAAQAGDGSGSTDSSGLKLAGGGAVAAVGAGVLGFALLRRRSGARG
ncbi:hypothetical protein [Kitasatospora sp. NPDC047058]|uniref:hypothetical protein n=1 Tax=Kitasatospora sp. NPDC047058 TaxID=3155620 RepID=UPI00341088B3